MASPKFIASRFDRAVTFDTHAEALRFVLKRGDANELWAIREVRS